MAHTKDIKIILGTKMGDFILSDYKTYSILILRWESQNDQNRDMCIYLKFFN